jgi:hypothetical protein
MKEIKQGRPTIYTKELVDSICEYIADGNSLKSICEREGMPDKSQVFNWLRIYPDFRNNYTQATLDRTEAHLELLNEMGEEAILTAQSTGDKRANAVVSAYKLKADNMKWVMARMKPKKYGDKIDMTTDGKAITVELVSYKKPSK